MTSTRRAVILPVVLLVLVLLGLLVAMFSFRVNADLATTRAVELRLQTRLAAEAGIDWMKMLLRDSGDDMERWYNNIDELHRIIVWSHDGDETIWGTNDELQDEKSMTYRFSIVADDPTDDEYFIRFGITDEASKLNINTATRRQLLMLVRRAAGSNQEIIPEQIVDAIMDWRDADRTPLGETGDTEGIYYEGLPKPYLVKNAPFDTVEELLLVKGVTGEILYGEDFDRNGLLTPNEDDGDQSFPPDDEDGNLNRGMYPFLTALSASANISSDNRPRVYLFGEEELVRAELTTIFPGEPNVVDFIVEATRDGAGGGGSTGKGGSGPGVGGGNPSGSTDIPSMGGGIGFLGGGDADGQGDGGSDPAGSDPPEGAETDHGQPGSGPIRSPASLLLDRVVNGEVKTSPLNSTHLTTLMERTTTVPVQQGSVPGLININTAQRFVLMMLEGLMEEQVDAILEARERQSSEAKASPTWLVDEGVLDAETFAVIAPSITTRAQQFTIESVGYADHVGMVTRLHVVVDMVGPIAQTIYYRDLSYIGGHFPIREVDLERQRVH